MGAAPPALTSLERREGNPSAGPHAPRRQELIKQAFLQSFIRGHISRWHLSAEFSAVPATCKTAPANERARGEPITLRSRRGASGGKEAKGSRGPRRRLSTQTEGERGRALRRPSETPGVTGYRLAVWWRGRRAGSAPQGRLGVPEVLAISSQASKSLLIRQEPAFTFLRKGKIK